MLDTHPDAEPYKPYWCTLCEKKVTAIINDKYCKDCWNDMKLAQEIFNSDKSPLDFMVSSNGSVRQVPDHCERCKKKFRFWRKENTVYDRSAHKFHNWKHVCIDCINMETDSY
jgi:hypothetical protein